MNVLYLALILVLGIGTVVAQPSPERLCLPPREPRVTPHRCNWAPRVNDDYCNTTTYELLCLPGADATCFHRPAVGLCKAFHRRFYFDPYAGRCLSFTYGGCGGNANNFPSLAACEDRCDFPGTFPATDSCAAVFCANCHRCEDGACVADSSLPGCAPVDACSRVRCAACHECRLNHLDQARCVYKPGCCNSAKPPVNCFRDPCSFANRECTNAAYCIAKFCTGCDAIFYDFGWNVIEKEDCVTRTEPAVGAQVCEAVDCGRCHVCRPRTVACKRAPCPQFTCERDASCGGEEENPCNLVDCQPGFKCIVVNNQAECVAEQAIIAPNPCDTVRCSSCHECRVNRLGQAKCVHKTGCCSGNERLVRCRANPCGNARTACPNSAICLANYCGGCNAIYYDLLLNELPRRKCAAVNEEYPCADVNCGECQVCVPTRRPCTQQPCVQFTCQLNSTCVSQADQCAAVLCLTGHVCRLINGRAQCEPVAPVANPAQQLRRCSPHAEAGPCDNALTRFAYSRTHGECNEFQYGGCGGNGNNFLTKAACENSCRGTPPCPIAKPAPAPFGCTYKFEMNKAFCYMPKLVCETPKEGSCPAAAAEQPGICVASSCNRDQDCKGADKCCRNGCGALLCMTPQHSVAPDEPDAKYICRQDAEVGRCRAAIKRWHWDHLRAECSEFSYGGCDGNENNFESPEACMQKCGALDPCPIPGLTPPPAGCEYETLPGSNGCPTYHLKCTGGACENNPCPDRCDRCINHDPRFDEACNGPACTTPAPFTCRKNRTCEAERDCTRILCRPGTVCRVVSQQARCVALDVPPPARCLLPKLVGPCEALIRAWHYNARLRACVPFFYGGCQGNDNRFGSAAACQRVCVHKRECLPTPLAAPPPGCRYESEEGNDGCPTYRLVCDDKPGLCPALRPRTIGVCAHDCERDADCDGMQKCCSNGCGRVCTSAIRRIEPDNPCRDNPCSECHRCVVDLKACALLPCKQYRCELANATCAAELCETVRCAGKTVCKLIGGEARCVADRPTPAHCLLPVEAGQCLALVPSFYFNNATGTCDRFHYGGCGGNANRFYTEAHCDRVCVEKRNCIIPPVAAPPRGCNYEVTRSDDGCPVYGPLVCKDKTGFCPPVTGAGICVERCDSDDGCAGEQKCCSNGCGHVCMAPRRIVGEPICPLRPLASPPRGCHYRSRTGPDGCPLYSLQCNETAQFCVPNPCEDACDECVADPKNCLVPPCPQFRCESTRVECPASGYDACRATRCPLQAGAVCRRHPCDCTRAVFSLDGRHLSDADCRGGNDGTDPVESRLF